MYRTVSVELNMKPVMKVDEGVEIQKVVDDMDCQFNLPDCATLDDSEVIDYSVMDSR